MVMTLQNTVSANAGPKYAPVIEIEALRHSYGVAGPLGHRYTCQAAQAEAAAQAIGESEKVPKVDTNEAPRPPILQGKQGVSAENDHQLCEDDKQEYERNQPVR